MAYIEAINVDEIYKDNPNWDKLWGIANTLLFNIVEKMKTKQKNALMRMCMI